MVKSTKELIFETAMELFNENPFEDVSVNDIIEKVGISKNTFYYHFKSKEAILDECYRFPSEITVSMLEVLLKEKSSLDSLFALYLPRIEHFTNVGKNISRQILMSNLGAHTGVFKMEKHSDDVKKIFMLEQNLIAQGQENGEFRNLSDPKLISKVIFKSILGTVFMWVIDTNAEDNIVEKVQNDIKVILNVVE